MLIDAKQIKNLPGSYVRAQIMTITVPLTAGLVTTVSDFSLLAPVAFAKTGGNANLSINTATGGISATVALTAGEVQTISGTITGADAVVLPFTVTMTGEASAVVRKLDYSDPANSQYLLLLMV